MKLLNESQAWKIIARAWRKFSQTGHINKMIRKDEGLCFSLKWLLRVNKINKNTYCKMNRKINKALLNKGNIFSYLFNTGRKYAKLRAEFAENKYEEIRKNNS